MSLLTRLRSALTFTGAAPAARMVGARPLRTFSIGATEFPWIDTTFAGHVSREMALAVPAVLKGRNMIAGVVSTLPIVVTDSANGVVANSLLAQIDPDVPNSVTIAQTVEDLLFEAISWWQVTARGFDNYPTSARHIDFHRITWQMPAGFPLNKLPSGYFPGSHAFVGSELVPSRDVIRFDSPNPALLVSAATTIRRALKLEAASDRFADNPAMRDFFTSVDGADPTDDDIADMIADWIAARNQQTTGYVPSGFERHDATVLTPAELQLAAQIDKVTLSLANAMGLDPEDVGLNTTSRVYRNAVDRRQDRLNECYGPYITAMQDRLSMPDITKRGQIAMFNLDAFLRANPTDRMAIQTGYLAAKVITRDEIRDEERLAPLTASQRKQLDAVPAVAATPPAVRDAAPNDASAPVDNVRPIRPAQGFSGSDAVALTFDLSDVAQTFSVNRAKRTITGLAMPWNRVGRADGRLWKFAPGSLKYDPALISRNKLLNDHDNSAGVGRLIKTWSDAVGQWVVYKVAKGPAGDAALALAHDRVKDGLSAGVGFAGENHGMTFAADPAGAGAGGVIYVTSAPWRETSLVAIPAFDDARISAVSFTADNQRGSVMPCATCGQVHAEGVTTCQTTPPVQPPAPAPAVTYTAEQVAAMFSALPGPTTPPVPETPAVVNPVRPGDLEKVTEAPLYRFDGGKAQRCFTADLAAVANGDQAVRVIVEKFMNTDMAAQFANITPANVATLNPVPTRPELYVPNLTFSSPLRDLVTTGPLDNLIAFIVPKFSSSSGLVADHTTGTEPTDGTYVTTSQTITPKGLSGRVDIDREVIDSGGSPQADQIIYADMVKEYTNTLEKRIVAALVALSLSDTAIVGTDGDLQQALISLFAGFQFLRGGDTFNSLGLESGLYKAIAKAKDDDGRLLFPMIGAVNAAGVTSTDLTSVRVSAKTGHPAWALEAANSGPAKSFLFNKDSVYQWSSAPRRFTFDQVNVSSIAIGIWGYSAEAVTRSSDVYQLGYSAS